MLTTAPRQHTAADDCCIHMNPLNCYFHLWRRGNKSVRSSVCPRDLRFHIRKLNRFGSEFFYRVLYLLLPFTQTTKNKTRRKFELTERFLVIVIAVIIIIIISSSSSSNNNNRAHSPPKSVWLTACQAVLTHLLRILRTSRLASPIKVWREAESVSTASPRVQMRLLRKMQSCHSTHLRPLAQVD